jgi:hypothetical protein
MAKNPVKNEKPKVSVEPDGKETRDLSVELAVAESRRDQYKSALKRATEILARRGYCPPGIGCPHEANKRTEEDCRKCWDGFLMDA